MISTTLAIETFPSKNNGDFLRYLSSATLQNKNDTINSIVVYRSLVEMKKEYHMGYMVPFKNFEGMAVTAKDLMTRVRNLCKKTSVMLYWRSPNNLFERY